MIRLDPHTQADNERTIATHARRVEDLLNTTVAKYGPGKLAFGKDRREKAVSSSRSPVNVIAPVIVAALVNGNDIVFVIDAVDD
jgi:hypothetical protein